MLPYSSGFLNEKIQHFCDKAGWYATMPAGQWNEMKSFWSQTEGGVGWAGQTEVNIAVMTEQHSLSISIRPNQICQIMLVGMQIVTC